MSKFYEIISNGTIAGHIAPTIHELVDGPWELPDAWRRAVAASSTIAVEVRADQGQGMGEISQIQIPDERVEATALEFGLSSKLVGRVKATAGRLGLALYLIETVKRELFPNLCPGVEEALFEVADSEGIPVADLERPRDQLQSISGEFTDLRVIIAQMRETAYMALQMAHAWRQGDVEGVSNLVRKQHGAAMGSFAERNTVQADGIAKLIETGQKPFAAVGALHLWVPDYGPTVLDLLREKGFEIREAS